jgi:hypothetical protein
MEYSRRCELRVSPDVDARVVEHKRVDESVNDVLNRAFDTLDAVDGGDD